MTKQCLPDVKWTLESLRTTISLALSQSLCCHNGKCAKWGKWAYGGLRKLDYWALVKTLRLNLLMQSSNCVTVYLKWEVGVKDKD